MDWHYVLKDSADKLEEALGSVYGTEEDLSKEVSIVYRYMRNMLAVPEEAKAMRERDRFRIGTEYVCGCCGYRSWSGGCCPQCGEDYEE